MLNYRLPEDEDDNNGDGRPGQRKSHMPPNPQFRTPIDTGRVFQVRWHLVKKRFQKKNTQRQADINHTQYISYPRVRQSNFIHQDKERNKAPRKRDHHGRKKHKKEKILPGKLQSGKRVGGQRRNQHDPKHHAGRVKNAV